MAVAMLVGKAPADQPPDDRFAQLGRNHLLDPGAVEPARGQLALHKADDVAALTHSAERFLEPFGEAITTAADVLGQVHRLQLAYSARRDRLLGRAVVCQL